jgi:tRNA A37 methylthiotransferase MiaB
VCVCGCWSQIEPEGAQALEADIVCGSGDRRGLIGAIERFCAERERVSRVDEALRRRSFEELPWAATPAAPAPCSGCRTAA